MPRYIRAKRTSSNSTTTDQLRDQFLRQLTREAEATLRQLTQQFNQDLERQSADFMGTLLGGNTSGSGSAGLFGIAASAGRYLFNKPKTKESTRETTRSGEETERFRLSQSQLMAEANATIARGEKNS
jgi:hypothetical protein